MCAGGYICMPFHVCVDMCSVYTCTNIYTLHYNKKLQENLLLIARPLAGGCVFIICNRWLRQHRKRTPTAVMEIAQRLTMLTINTYIFLSYPYRIYTLIATLSYRRSAGPLPALNMLRSFIRDNTQKVSHYHKLSSNRVAQQSITKIICWAY